MGKKKTGKHFPGNISGELLFCIW